MMPNETDTVSALMEFISSLGEKDKIQVHGEITTITTNYPKCPKEHTQNIRGRPDKTGNQETLSVRVMGKLRPEGRDGAGTVNNRNMYPSHWR